MWRYVSGVEEPSTKRQKLGKKARDNAYDRTKKARKFVPSWKDKYKLVTNSELDKMFCEFCLGDPTVANKSGSFFVSTLKFEL